MTNYSQTRREIIVATIPNSETTSNAINCRAKSLVALEMPSAFTGTEITVKSSFDGIAYQNVYNSSGVQFAISISASRNIHFLSADFLGAKYIKFISNASEGAEREIKLILMGV